MQRISVNLVILFSFLIYLPLNVSSANVKQFRIYDFNVVVQQFELDSSRTRPSPIPVGFDNPKSLNKRVIKGQGVTTINGHRVNVEFGNIELRYDTAIVSPRRDLPISIPPLVAVAGVVKGSSQNPSYLSYTLDSNTVYIDPRTLTIKPNQATAVVSIKTTFKHFTNITAPLSLNAPSARISSNGSVAASNIRKPINFNLKHTPLKLKISPFQNYRINLGTKFRESIYGQRGIHIQGKAEKDNVEAFNFTGFVDRRRAVVLRITQEHAFDTFPDRYWVHVSDGYANISYNTSGNVSIGGTFHADIIIPDTIKNTNNQPLQKLENQTLNLDQDFSLNNKIELGEKVRIGQRFLYVPERDGVWAYFPNWPLNQPYSSFPEKPRTCDQWRKAFEDLLEADGSGGKLPAYAIHRRPGITLIKGVVLFDSPQISKADSNTQLVIKSRVRSVLTLTELGVVGPMSGASASFVSADSDIKLGDEAITPPRTSWQTIIKTEDAMPEVQAHRFKLANLRILDMQLIKAYFCRSEMEPDSAIFNYSVHFPHPSYINLLFEDKSLNQDGRFSFAKGPVTPKYLIVPLDVSDGELSNLGSELPKYAVTLPNPDTHILWAWRLPISFSEKGVHIEFDAADNRRSDIRVKMFDASSSEPEALLSAQQQTTMMNNGEASGRITSSEMWLKPLYSKNSAIRKGIRFKAIMSSADGSFKVVDIDKDPFLAPMYAAPGLEQKVGLLVRLNALDLGGFVIADPSTNPVNRDSDYSWHGKIQFPFFSDLNQATWEMAHFSIKDQLPKMKETISMANAHLKYQCESENSGACMFTQLPSPLLSVKVEELDFDWRQTAFATNKIEASEEKEGIAERLDSKSLKITSFTNAVLQLNFPDNSEPYPVTKDYGNTGDCGRELWTRNILTDWQPSDNQRDLVCFDQNASCVRGQCGIGTCSKQFIAGTYEIRTRTCESLDDGQCEEKTIFKAPNAKYYPDLKHFDLNRSNVITSTDASENPYDTVINIPSAQIAVSEDGRFIEGAFGATYAQVATSLPYEGFFTFKLDNKCGYYYFYGGGSFTYALTFRGQVIIFNSPYEFLKEPSPFFMVTDTLRTLTIRALYDSEAKFAKAAGLDKVEDETIISGLITSGNAEFGWGYGIYGLSVKAGPGLVLYQYKNTGEVKKYRIGTFLRVIGTGEVDLGLIGASITGSGELSISGGLPEVESLDELESYQSEGDFSLHGSMELKGCADATWVYCQGILEFPKVTYDTDSGFKADGVDLDAECDRGSCNN